MSSVRYGTRLGVLKNKQSTHTHSAGSEVADSPDLIVLLLAHDREELGASHPSEPSWLLRTQASDMARTKRMGRLEALRGLLI